MGVVSWHAVILVDAQARIVAINDIVVTDARFPSVDAAQSAAMERLIRDTYPAVGMTISLDRLLAGFKLAQAPPRAAALNTEPPAILLFVDGEPIRVPIEGTRLAYVVNTNWDLLYDQSDYYLLEREDVAQGEESLEPLDGDDATSARPSPSFPRVRTGMK